MKRHTFALLILFVLAFVFLVVVRDRQERARSVELHRAADFLGVAVIDLLEIIEPTAHGAVQATGFRSEVGISGQTIANPTTSTALSVPNNAEHAWIVVKANPVCYTNTAPATDATAGSGGEWPAGFVTKLDNDRAQLLAFRVINCAEGATTVKVWYTRTRRVNE
jgi:hypothetical protein